MNCDRTPPWLPTTCNMFWYKDFLCCFFRFHFVRISSDFSSGALWQNVLPQDFATNSFVRISLGFRQNLNWSNEIFDEISTEFSRSFFVAKGVAKWIATRIATKSSTKALTNSQRPTDVIPFLLQIMSSTNTRYTSVPVYWSCPWDILGSLLLWGPMQLDRCPDWLSTEWVCRALSRCWRFGAPVWPGSTQRVFAPYRIMCHQHNWAWKSQVMLFMRTDPSQHIHTD